MTVESRPLECGLSVLRDDRGQAVELSGRGVAHRRRDDEDGWTHIEDPLGTTSMRQDEQGTQIFRHGHMLSRRMSGPEVEEWILPGTPAPVSLARDAAGDLLSVRLGGRDIASRADTGGRRVLRWVSGDAGVGALDGGGQGVTLGPREWAASSVADALTLGRDHYQFDAQGRVVSHNHPEYGCTRYQFADDQLIGVHTPTDTVELHHGSDGRLRSKRDVHGRTTYGYDESGRRIRETGPEGVRHLIWDDLDRLVEVRIDGQRVLFGYDGFGRRVSRAAGGEIRHEHRDLQGRLWAITDESGRALRTWLWDKHLCVAAFDGPVDRTAPAAVYATAPSGIAVGFLDCSGTVHDLPATPYGEDRPSGHPALSFHFADELTGYIHATQRDIDPRTWQFLSADPNRGDGEDRRRSLLGLDGPLSAEQDPRAGAYAVCGFDPVRRVDPNGAVSAGTVLWQLFGGLTWHLPAHIINWLWIHPVVNFSFTTLLFWLPASGFDPRGAFDSWYEFWDPDNYSGEESDRQDIASMLMAGWMSSNRTFTFQNAIWGRQKVWQSLEITGSLEPGAPFRQQRFGSLFRVTRGGTPNADAVDGWSFVADGVDASAAATRQFSMAGGRVTEAVFGSGRERVITQGNLHVARTYLSQGVNIPGADPAAPTQAPLALHSQATAVQECPPGNACAQVTVRSNGQIFSFTGAADPAIADGDVVRLFGVLTLVTAVQRRPAGASETTEMSVRAGHPNQPLPTAGGLSTAQWATRDPAAPQVLAPAPGVDRLTLADDVVAWAPQNVARINGTSLATVSQLEGTVAVFAQGALAQGADVVPLGVPVRVAGARLEPDERLRVPNGAVVGRAVLQLRRGGVDRLARVVTVGDDPATGDDLLALDATPTVLALPGAGAPEVFVLTPQLRRGTLDAAVPAGAQNMVTRLDLNTVLPATTVGFDVGGVFAVPTGAETRALVLSPTNPIAAAPFSVERFTFPPGARSRAGALSGLLQMLQFDAGDAAAAIPADALLRLRTAAVPAVPPVAGLTRVGDNQLDHAPAPAPVPISAGDLVAVAGATTQVVSVADIALTVTIDRAVGAAGNAVERVCTLVNGERQYNAVWVAVDALRLTGTATVAGAAAEVLLPDWLAGDIVRTVVGGTTQEWVLDADLNGGRLRLRGGPGVPLAGAAGNPATVRRLVPTWPPLAVAETETGRRSEVVAPTQHRWVTLDNSLTANTPVGIQVGGQTFVARVTVVNTLSMRTSRLPAAPITGYAQVSAATGADLVAMRWRLVGDEILLTDPAVSTQVPGPAIVDALAPLPAAPVTPKAPAVMCPAEPENVDRIFTAREALREHELRHTLQSSMWGPLMLGLPLGAVGDVMWDLRGAGGGFEASPYETVEPVPEDATADPPRPAGFQLPAPTGGFRLAVGEVVEFDAGGKAWRTVIVAVDGSAAPAKFWVQNLPPDGFADELAGGLKARTLHHTGPKGEGWLKLFRAIDLLSNAHIMEFTTGLIFEGFIGMIWRIGRLFSFVRTDTAAITVTDDPTRLNVRATSEAALAKLHLAVGSEVTIDSNAVADDSYRTVVTAMSGVDITLRDAVPRYSTAANIRLWRGQDKDPDDFWDLRSYATASVVDGTRNVITLTGTNPPALQPMDIVQIKWTDPDSTPRSMTNRVTAVAGAAPPTYQLGDTIDLRSADPDTLRVARLRNEDDPTMVWFDTAFYETPLRIRRVTQYLFDPWRALTKDANFVRPADGSTFKTVMAWIARGVRYAVSNHTWTPLFGYIWWTSIFGKDHMSGLEQSASWNGGDLYTTITRSGDPRFAESEGGHGDEPGDYDIYEGELLRMWTWESSRYNDVFASRPLNTGTVAAVGGTANQNPALVSAANRVTPWDDRWRFTAPPGLIAGLEYPAELARLTGGQFQPSPLLQIPTRRDVCRTSGVYFAACQAGAWQVGVAAPTVRDQDAQGAGEQYHTRTVQVSALTVTAGGTTLRWQANTAPTPALSLFVTQEQSITVTGGESRAVYRLRLIDVDEGDALYRPADLTLRARITPGVTEFVEVVRVYEVSDSYFTQFGSYVSRPLIIPVRRFQVTVNDDITLVNGTDPGSPVIAAGTAVLPGDVVSVFLPVTTSVPPGVAFNPAAPAGAPPLPVATGPLPAGALNRYQFATSPEPPAAPVTVDVVFTFADPHPAAPAGTVHPVTRSFAINPAATLNGPATVAPNTSVTLTVAPFDGSALVPADVTVPAANAIPTPGITVSADAAGQIVVAAAGAAVGAAFQVRVQWKGRWVVHAMTVG